MLRMHRLAKKETLFISLYVHIVFLVIVCYRKGVGHHTINMARRFEIENDERREFLESIIGISFWGFLLSDDQHRYKLMFIILVS
jgi:hypothetical protein